MMGINSSQICTRLSDGTWLTGKAALDVLFEEMVEWFFVKARWPDGISCPRCGHSHISWLMNQHKYECARCEYQFTITSGTFLHKTRVPLYVWFLFWHLLRSGRSILSASKEVDLSYPTAHRMAKLIMKEAQ